MQRSRKRGVTAIEFLGVILLILIGGFVVIGTIKVFYSKSEGTQAEALCRSSVEMRAKTILGLEWQGIIEHKIALAPLLCKTQDKEISGTAEQVMKELAKLMARCKWMFADGRFTSVLKGEKGGETCFPCYTVVIKEIKNADYIHEKRFEDFLASTTYKSDMAYLDYLIRFQDVPSKLLMPETIKAGHIYQIYYVDINIGQITILGGWLKLRGGDKASGIYLADPNELPQTWIDHRIDSLWFGTTKACEVIEDVQGR